MSTNQSLILNTHTLTTVITSCVIINLNVMQRVILVLLVQVQSGYILFGLLWSSFVSFSEFVLLYQGEELFIQLKQEPTSSRLTMLTLNLLPQLLLLPQCNNL